jgi:hypothetical protein
MATMWVAKQVYEQVTFTPSLEAIEASTMTCPVTGHETLWNDDQGKTPVEPSIQHAKAA